MTQLDCETAALDQDVVRNSDRSQWMERRLQKPISCADAITWLETFNLHSSAHVFSLAREQAEAGNMMGAIEMLRYFACASLQQSAFHNATVAVDQLHAWFVDAAISPRDFFLDDYLNRYLPKFCTDPRTANQSNEIKLGYLVPLSLVSESTIPPIPVELAARHSKDISAKLFIPYQRQTVFDANPQLVKYLEATHAKENIVYHTQDHENEWARVHSFAEIIGGYELDGLVTMLSLYADSLISYMRPARRIYAIDGGHPHWYSHRFMDMVFSGHPQFQLEAQTDSIYVPLGFAKGSHDFKAPKAQTTPEDIKFPKKSDVVLFSSGSIDKFYFDGMWTAVNAILRDTGANWLFLGPDPDFVYSRIDASLHPLVQAFPRSTNFDHFLSHTTLYVDTFPIGGGYSLLECFEKGIPCALYGHDFSHPFNKRKMYAPYSHISDNPTFASTSDIDGFQAHITKLIGSEEMRHKQIDLQHEAATQVLTSDPLISAIEQTLHADLS